MKAVIIGGGIAGITMGILLHRKGLEVIINERSCSIPLTGNAFLMHSEGVSILKELGNGYSHKKIPGKLVDTYSLRRPTDEEIKFQNEIYLYRIKQFPRLKFCNSLYIFSN